MNKKFEKIGYQHKTPDILTISNWIKRKSIYIPSFQREFIYDNSKSSKLVESCILGIPLPPIYLIKDSTGKSQVIDGQQRLTSLSKFYNNEFELKNLKTLPELNCKKFEDLDDEIKTIFEETSLTFFVFDYQNEDKKFDIFERINKGAIALNHQEIRNCVYHGLFNDTLKKNIKDISKNILNKMFKSEKNRRIKYEENLLWIFSLNDNNWRNYKRSKQKQIDDYMQKVYKLEDTSEIDNLIKTFKVTASIFSEYIGYDIFLKGNKFSETLFDAVFLPIFQCIYKEKNCKQKLLNVMSQLKNEIEKLKNNQEFEQYTNGSSGNKEKVINRIKMFDDKLFECLKNADKRNFNFSNIQKEELAKKNNYICSVCGQKIIDIQYAEVDHIIPYSKEGETNIENAQILHKYCNRRKNND